MKLVKQKYKLDCGVACMAMLLHCSYDDTAGYFDQDFSCEDMDESDLREGIEKYGKQMKTRKEFDITLQSIIILPSLNNMGEEHAVCWSGSEVFDPNNGNPTKKVYSTKEFLEVEKFSQFSIKPMINMKDEEFIKDEICYCIETRKLNDDVYKNCWWEGKYTNGHVYEKGTRIQFVDPIGIFDFGGFYVREDENYGEITSYDLKSVIDDLEEKNIKWKSGLRYYNKSLKLLIQKFEEITLWEQDVSEQLHAMSDKKYEFILRDMRPTTCVWFLNDKKDIIKELKNIMIFLKDKNIRFHWT